MFKENRNLLIIALIAVVNALGYAIIIPLLYSYSVKYGLSDFQNGLLFATFSVCQFFSTPVIGRLSDRYGRKPLLLISLAGTALSFFTMAFAPTALFLFISRALDGITAGNIPVALAVISDTTSFKDRAKGFGIITASFNFGFIFGPAISAFTVGFNPIYPFLIAAVISSLAVLITAVFLPETNQHIGEVKHEKLFDFKKLFHALTRNPIGATLLVTLFYFTAFSLFLYGFQSASVKVVHMTLNQLSLLFSLFGVVGFVTQFFILQRVTKFLGTKKTLVYSLIGTSIIFVSMFFTRTITLFVSACVLLGFISPFVQPITQTVLSEETDVTEQGEMQGINASYMSIGQIIGPVIAGLLATYSLSLPFVGAGVLCFVCYLLSFRIFSSLAAKRIQTS